MRGRLRGQRWRERLIMGLCLGKGQVADGAGSALLQLSGGLHGKAPCWPPAGPHNGPWCIIPVSLALASATLASDVSAMCQACFYPRAFALASPVIWDASPRMSSRFTPLPGVSQVC